jgi:hypothetical protein
MGALTAAARAASAAQNGAVAVYERWRFPSFAFLAGALFISQWALAPRYLITFDEINFALAVRDFNPALHQPQPPGYPLFVALLKLMAVFLPKIETVFLAAGLIASGIALVFVWKLGEAIGGPRCGIVSAWLLVFNPAFWLSGLSNPVRLCFAAGASGVALCVWLACRRSSGGWLIAAAAALGIAAGFRPGLAVLMMPAILWAAFRIRLRWTMAAAALLCFFAAVATWLPGLAAAVGGFRQLINLLAGYSHSEIGGTSILFGASIRDSLDMTWKAIVWSCLGALSWIWAVPVLLRQKCRDIFDPLTGRFLLLWFLPGLIYYATFHVGDPDHTLSIIPATCIAGALVLTALTKHYSPRGRMFVFAAAVLLNVFLFLKPISKTAKASTYRPVQWLDGYIKDVIDGTGALRHRGPVLAVFYEPVTGWRQLSYYHPDVRILTVLRDHAGQTTVRNILGADVNTRTRAGETISLPSCGTLAWVDPVAGPTRKGGDPMESTNSRVHFAPAVPGESFDFHGFHFVASASGCRGGELRRP